METGIKQSVSASYVFILYSNGIFGCIDMKCIMAGKQN